MITLSQPDLAWLPSLHSLTSSVVADVVQQRSVCLLVPRSIDLPSFRRLLVDRLSARSLHVASVPAAGLPAAELPAALADAFGLVWTYPHEPRTIDGLLDLPGLSDVVLLEDIELLGGKALVAWLRLVEQWAAVSQGRALRGLATPCIVVVAPAATIDAPPPVTNVRLAVRWWWGCPTAVEVRLLCRSWSDGDESSALVAWREHLIPSLAGNDLDLAELLLDDVTLPSGDLAERLRTYAVGRGWTVKELQRLGAGDFAECVATRADDGAAGVPPKRLEALWAIGALHWTPEFGLEVHSAAVALLGWHALLNRRIWRGQAALLLPLLNEARIAICNRLTAAYGPDWPLRWEAPRDIPHDEAIPNDPSACEWGYLERLFLRYAPATRFPSLRDVVIRARFARNELAHGKPVPFATYEPLWRKLQGLMA